MDWYNNTRKIRLEWTSYCNAACPGCERNIQGGDTKPDLVLAHLPPTMWTRLLSEIQQMNIMELDFNGAVGDMIMHPRCLEMLAEFTKKFPKINIRIATNGGARSIDFWTQMGKTLSNQPHMVAFAIDGLEDTHHIHRRRTSYKRVVENMQAFTRGGGIAKWVYTLFDHNVHQVSTAEQRARDLGVHFSVRRSCIGNEDLKTPEYNITVDNIENYPTYSVAGPHYNPSEDFESINHACKMGYADRSISIDYMGNVHPCTNLMYWGYYNRPPRYRTRDGQQETQPIHNLNKHSLREILTGEWFTQVVPRAIDQARWEKCRTWCNVG